MKIANMTPIFKSGRKGLLTNYRSISVLSCFPWILERIIYSRLSNCMNDNNLLFNKQFGFSKSFSHALIELINSIYDSFNQRKHTPGVLVTLSKVVDTVGHNISLTKIRLHGMKSNIFNWFSSYLSRRKQFVQAGNTNISKFDIIYGVPQGSILWSLLFIT